MDEKTNTQAIKTPLTCLIVGAGTRGKGYSMYAIWYPQEMKVVGVAEPSEARRNKIVDIGTVEKENIFSDWREAAQREKFADFVIIATTDQYHKEPAVAFARLGYHILLEKPLAVGFWHFAHSFVRGTWRNVASSTFSLLSKSSHDIDLIHYWMSPRKCVSVSSFGKLTHFVPKDKPPKATARCLDCPEEPNCPYSAKRLYLGLVKRGHTGWPVSVLTDVVDIESVTEALKTGPYGRCVYDSDNDVVSHQVVNFQFDDGATACFNMVAFTKRLCAREVKVYGTRGEIVFEDGSDNVEVFDFLTETTTNHDVKSNHPQFMAGHGGSDFFLVKSFLEALQGAGHKVVTGAQETLNSHLLVFAAEKSRLENRVVTISPESTF